MRFRLAGPLVLCLLAMLFFPYPPPTAASEPTVEEARAFLERTEKEL